MSVKDEDVELGFTLSDVPVKWLRELQAYSGVNPLVPTEGIEGNLDFLVAMATFKRRLDDDDPTISFESMENLTLDELAALINPPTPEAKASTPAATGGARGSRRTTASARGK